MLEKVHWMYVAALTSLIAVLLFGQRYLGAKRWIKLPGGSHFQPSEWVKLILILAVAKYFADLQQQELSWSDFLKAGAIVGFPMLLVLKQPDLGTALTYLPIAVMGLFLGGLRMRQAGIVLLLAALCMPLAWHHMKDFPLLADVEHKVAEKYGAWREKNMYGKKSMGIQPSTYLIDAEGKIRKIWKKVSVDGHDEAVLSELKKLAAEVTAERRLRHGRTFHRVCPTFAPV